MLSIFWIYSLFYRYGRELVQTTDHVSPADELGQEQLYSAVRDVPGQQQIYSSVRDVPGQQQLYSSVDDVPGQQQLYNPRKSPLKNRNEILCDILGISGWFTKHNTHSKTINSQEHNTVQGWNQNSII